MAENSRLAYAIQRGYTNEGQNDCSKYGAWTQHSYSEGITRRREFGRDDLIDAEHDEILEEIFARDREKMQREEYLKFLTLERVESQHIHSTQCLAREARLFGHEVVCFRYHHLLVGMIFARGDRWLLRGFTELRNLRKSRGRDFCACPALRDSLI